MTWDEEERRAWDLYAAALIGSGVSSGSFADVARDADKLLEERRKRFPQMELHQTMGPPEMRVEPGEGIGEACKKLAAVAPAFMVFNGITVDARLGATPGELAAQWSEKISRRR
jgi:hypothetical protein